MAFTILGACAVYVILLVDSVAQVCWNIDNSTKSVVVVTTMLLTREMNLNTI